MDINSIIEMINKLRDDSYAIDYMVACDDIIEQLRKMSEWHPMETAPKDGTEILLCSAVIHDIGVCYWREDNLFKGWTWGMDQRFNHPIGWLPLPNPPSKAL